MVEHDCLCVFTVKVQVPKVYKTLSWFSFIIFDTLYDTYTGQAVLLAKGHESMS